MKISHIIILAVIVALTGCSRAPFITITNRSTVTLSNLVVSGLGFSRQIDSLAAGADYKFTVHSRGESGLRIVFDAGGQHIDGGDQGYFEAGNNYRVTAIISTNLSVSVSSDIRSY